MTTTHKLIHIWLAQISLILSINSPWEGPEQDAIFFSPAVFTALCWRYSTQTVYLRKSSALNSSDTCWVAEMVCYHDMTDWVSARTILKWNNCYLGKRGILNTSCLFSSKWGLYIMRPALSSLTPCLWMPALGCYYFHICMRWKHLGAHAR